MRFRTLTPPPLHWQPEPEPAAASAGGPCASMTTTTQRRRSPSRPACQSRASSPRQQQQHATAAPALRRGTPRRRRAHPDLTPQGVPKGSGARGRRLGTSQSARQALAREKAACSSPDEGCRCSAKSTREIFPSLFFSKESTKILGPSSVGTTHNKVVTCIHFKHNT
jgi:hypothetical protein